MGLHWRLAWVDFAPVFTWNTKQVFAFVTVEYENQEFGRNEIVIWDKIIRQTDSHLVDDYNLSSEYNIADIKQALPYAFFLLENDPHPWRLVVEAPRQSLPWNGPSRIGLALF